MRSPSGVLGSLDLAISGLPAETGPGRAGETALGLVLSDAQLIALARTAHAQAFEMLYGAYKARIYTFLLRMLGEPETADDVAQDVFTKAFRALPTLTAEHRVLPWLYRVANNAAVDHIRRGRRFTWLRIGNLHGTPEEPQTADEHGRVPEREHVQATLRKLPPENASALLLHALEGYSYREIAEIQGCTMTAVRSRIARARASFKAQYATK
ncbi:MAG: RNA polymerase sigma factor [Thermoleophilaceae bacterium]